MKLLHVQYTLTIPAEVTAAEAEAWLRYHLGLGAIDQRNPLLDQDVADLLRPASLCLALRDLQGVWAA